MMMMSWTKIARDERLRMPRLACLLAGWMLLIGPFSTAQSNVVVVNGASLRPDQPVAAGSWVTGLGAFPSVGAVVNFRLPVPQQLGGVTVTVNGVAAPINYVSSAKIIFLIPYETPPGLHPVVVNVPGGVVGGTVRIINAAPGLFTLDDETPPQGMIFNEDYITNGENRPAIRGQVIRIYATGHGFLDQQIADGAPGPLPAAETQVPPQVYLGGVECVVENSQLLPGVVALWEITARIPNLPFLSGKLPVQVFMNGVDSNEVTIYVAQ